MNRWEKSRREFEKSSRNPKIPSFSSTLLDEIYRSIDGNHEKGAEEQLREVYGKKSVNKNDKYMNVVNYCRSNNNGGSAGVVLLRKKVEDEEEAATATASVKTRTSLIEKWMDKKAINSGEKVWSRRSRTCSSSLPEIDDGYIMKSSASSLMLSQDNDPLFFSSSSISSDSSSGGLSSSSSDTEFFSSSCSSSSSSNKNSRRSCFTSAGGTKPWPKPVRTSISRPEGYEFNTADDQHKNRQKTKDQETLIKSKNRAMKIYANLKNVKQPISPGARLTSFINSLFTNGNNTKKSNINTNSEKVRKGEGKYEDPHSERKSKSTQSSSISYSAFSKSCLSKTPPPPPPPPPPQSQPRGEEKLLPDSSSLTTITTTKRTVRFYPVSVIVDEDCRPCGHKCLFDEQNPNQQIQNSSINNRDGSTVKRIISHPEEVEEDYDDDEEEDDGYSDSSSDLFEIDHLSLYNGNGNNGRFLEELPVYETTHLDRNRAIASGLIR